MVDDLGSFIALGFWVPCLVNHGVDKSPVVTSEVSEDSYTALVICISAFRNNVT